MVQESKQSFPKII